MLSRALTCRPSITLPAGLARHTWWLSMYFLAYDLRQVKQPNPRPPCLLDFQWRFRSLILLTALPHSQRWTREPSIPDISNVKEGSELVSWISVLVPEDPPKDALVTCALLIVGGVEGGIATSTLGIVESTGYSRSIPCRAEPSRNPYVNDSPNLARIPKVKTVDTGNEGMVAVH